jgi:2-keto-3-deoxy-L-rhamnonate aldolase RhmA
LRDNIVRTKIKRGEPVYGTMVTEFEHPALPVILADAGFDFFFLDLEHGTFSLQAVATIVQAGRLANIAPFVRVPDGLYHLIAPVLDAGAMGIVVPRVETREVVERSLAAMHYPPRGVRGMFGGKGNNDYRAPSFLEYTRHANENILSIIQIESKRAVDSLDDLLTVPGLDVALVGPWDLALSLGVTPGDALVDEMTQKVVQAAKQRKVASGIQLADPEQIKQWRLRGMTLLSCLTDLEMLRNSAQALGKALHA